MMTEEEFYKRLAQLDIEFHMKEFWYDYVKARKYDALESCGVDHWIYYEDAMQSLKDECNSNS